MKKQETKIETTDLKGFAEMMGIDYQVVQIKSKLIEEIKKECKEKSISQRKLAFMVPGLTHDRISKIFSGHIGHMTIDKLLEILSSLNIKASILFRKRTA